MECREEISPKLTARCYEYYHIGYILINYLIIWEIYEEEVNSQKYKRRKIVHKRYNIIYIHISFTCKLPST